MSATSPNWKRPSDIMKRHRRKKTPVASGRPALGALKPQNGQLGSQKLRTSPGGRKRKNPFSSSPHRKASVRLSVQSDGKEVGEKTSGKVQTPSVLDSILQTREQPESEQSANVSIDSDVIERSPQSLEGNDHSMNQKMASPSSTTSPIPSAAVASPAPAADQPRDWPTDWSLKTKARFVSPASFNWCHPLKTQEEAKGLCQYVRCQAQDDAEVVDPTSEVSKCRLQSCCNVWQHPHIPWLKLFPRMASDNKIGKGPALAQNEDIHNAFMADWTASLNSVFNLTRARQCPYFYLCAHQFTAVFHAAGVRGREQMHALLGPTSRGFREAMKAEGIEYSLPLYRRTSGDSVTLSPSQPTDDSQSGDAVGLADAAPSSAAADADTAADCGADDEESDEIRQTDDGASSWLHDLGLDTARYRSLDPSKVKLHRETFREIDHRAESTILVEGPNTLALYNFLLNCRSCVANTGIQQGLPPTILAPVAFRGATLQTMKVKTGSVKQQTDQGLQHWYSLEVWGPLLPSNLHSLCSLLAETQRSYTAIFSTHEPTTPLNSTPPLGAETSEQQIEGLENCGVSQGHIETVVRNNLGGKRAVRELACTDRRYAWTT